MGVSNNECVIATILVDGDELDKVKKWVAALSPKQQSLFAFIVGFKTSVVTVFMAPCGDKKGHDEDIEATALREDFITLLKSFDDEEDGGWNPFKWIEVGYGEYGQKVLRGNCGECVGPYLDDQ